MNDESTLARLAALAAAFVLGLLGCTEEPKVTKQDPRPAEIRVATFGGGCFWCTEAIYERIDGVLEVTSGYAGGKVEKPRYDQVTSGMTGHAEVIQIRFDAAKVSYLDLLKVFFATHDPTTLNRQGADFGTQYRSAIFVHDEAQRTVAEALVKALGEAEAFTDPIVTQIEPFDAFWPAEAFHQDFFANNPSQGYCRMVVVPKVEKFEKAFKRLLK